jgi:biotin carboxyl carrier protein
VAADAPAVIVEAMKMENEVRTTGSGKVTRVLAKPGDTVEVGQLLVELAPHDATSA